MQPVSYKVAIPFRSWMERSQRLSEAASSPPPSSQPCGLDSGVHQRLLGDGERQTGILAAQQNVRLDCLDASIDRRERPGGQRRFQGRPAAEMRAATFHRAGHRLPMLLDAVAQRLELLEIAQQRLMQLEGRSARRRQPVDQMRQALHLAGDRRVDRLVEGGGHGGACWAFIQAKLGQFIYGVYPLDQRWRVDVLIVALVILVAGIAIPKVPYKRLNAVLLFGVYPVVTLVLLTGGQFSFSGGGLAVLFLLAAGFTIADVSAEPQVGTHSLPVKIAIGSSPSCST